MQKVVVITGASEGIGAELARQWAARERGGLALVLAARNTDKLQAVAAECQAMGSTVLVQRCDVSRQAEGRELVAQTLARFGRLDVLVNNAGISAHALLADVPDLGWYEDLMRVNFWGSVWLTHAALPYLRASRGQVLAVSSLAGLVGIPGRTAYCSSKSAMNGFFEALRIEEAEHGVAVTLAYPGVVDTRIRYHGLNAQGQQLGASSLDERGAMPVQECARLILDGTLARRREIVMTAKGRLGRWLKLLAPGLVDRMARAALNKEAGAR